MLALMKEHIGHLLLINSKFLDVMLVFGIIKVVEGLPNLLRVFREGFA